MVTKSGGLWPLLHGGCGLCRVWGSGRGLLRRVVHSGDVFLLNVL